MYNVQNVFIQNVYPQNIKIKTVFNNIVYFAGPYHSGVHCWYPKMIGKQIYEIF